MYQKVAYDRRHDYKGITTFDHMAALEDFRQMRSLTEVGKKYGVTRERIRQIVKEYAPQLRPRTKDRPTQCRRCFRRGIYIFYTGYCVGCSRSVKQGRKRVNIRTKTCLRCDKVLGKRHDRGLCRRCRYQTDPVFREKRKAYVREYFQTPKGKALMKRENHEYYLKHKKELTLYHQARRLRNKLLSTQNTL
jgi:hypothetical protein